MTEALDNESLPRWVQWNLEAIVVATLMLLVVDTIIGRNHLRGPVHITSGPHKGRVGNVVSISWFGNGWNTRASVNVPATEPEIRAIYGQSADRGWADSLVEDMHEGHGPRTWVDAWAWELETKASEDGR